MKSNRQKFYELWHETAMGDYSAKVCEELLRRLLAGWVRRSHTVIVFNAGGSNCPKLLWEAGLDITAQEDDPFFMNLARCAMGNCAEYVLSNPEHLPFDDGRFDYAVAIAALEFWENPALVLAEAARLARRGLILIYPNIFSLFGLECSLRKNNNVFKAARKYLQSPHVISRLLQQSYQIRPALRLSVLPLPSIIWQNSPFLNRLNFSCLPFSLGAFTGLRLDISPGIPGTTIPLRKTAPCNIPARDSCRTMRSD